jgi:hypothetical protein
MKLVLFMLPKKIEKRALYGGSLTVEHTATIEATGRATLTISELASPPMTLSDVAEPSNELGVPRVASEAMLGPKFARKFRVTVEEVPWETEEEHDREMTAKFGPYFGPRWMP